MDRVRAAARAAWGDKPPLGTDRLKYLIVYIYEGPSVRQDDDNIAKPIRDALNNLVYLDDRQIKHSETVLQSIDAKITVKGLSPVVFTAYANSNPFVYVRIEDAADYGFPR